MEQKNVGFGRRGEGSRQKRKREVFPPLLWAGLALAAYSSHQNTQLLHTSNPLFKVKHDDGGYLYFLHMKRVV